MNPASAPVFAPVKALQNDSLETAQLHVTKWIVRNTNIGIDSLLKRHVMEM